MIADVTSSGYRPAGLARDKNTAKLVNVLPAECPQDAYKVVANTATPTVLSPSNLTWTEKREAVVMTVPYNVKPQ